jgi:Na+/melibiose symporter-like transporter
MSASGAPDWVDEVRTGSVQRLVLGLLATIAPPGACALAVAVSPVPRSPTVALLAIGLLALMSAMQPDGHLPLVTIVVAAGYWIAVVPDHASPWSMALAMLLYVFHTLTALMATTPRSAAIDRATLWRYAARSGAIALVLVGTWAVVELFSGRHAPGNPVLTGAAVVVIIAAAVAVRALSLGHPLPPGHEAPGSAPRAASRTQP